MYLGNNVLSKIREELCERRVYQTVTVSEFRHPPAHSDHSLVEEALKEVLRK